MGGAIEVFAALLLVGALAALVRLVRPKRKVVLRRPAAAPAGALRESVGPSGSAPHLKHTPAPGSVVVEATTGDFQPLALDTFRCSHAAPLGTEAPWTTVIAPSGAATRSYKFGVFASGEPLPFALPSHLARPDVAYYRVWWSMEAHDA